jgi:hypothetical protein
LISFLLHLLTTYTLLLTILTTVLHQQPIFVTHLAANMVDNALDIVTQFIHNTLQKSHTRPSVTQQFLTTTSLSKTRITPLMAQPFEVVNVTNGNTGGTQGDTKPPDKPNG